MTGGIAAITWAELALGLLSLITAGIAGWKAYRSNQAIKAEADLTALREAEKQERSAREAAASVPDTLDDDGFRRD